VQIYLRLKALVEEMRDFDIDEEFIVVIDESTLGNKKKLNNHIPLWRFGFDSNS